MEFLSKNKNSEDLFILGKICFDILSTEFSKDNLFTCQKPPSDDFCGIYYEGRNRQINSIEDFAVIKSFKLYSEYNYPMLVFCNNDSNFLGGKIDTITNRITIIKVPEANTHDEYSQFFIRDLFNLIPDRYENLLFHHPDGFLIKSGWERYVTGGKFDYIGSPWLHSPSIDAVVNGEWMDIKLPPVTVGNGGFSFRKRSSCLNISIMYSNYRLRERFRDDNRPPPEDLFYSFFLNGNGYKVANIAEAKNFSIDPITLEEYNRKISFGFHCPKHINEWKRKIY